MKWPQTRGLYSGQWAQKSERPPVEEPPLINADEGVDGWIRTAWSASERLGLDKLVAKQMRVVLIKAMAGQRQVRGFLAKR